MTETLKIGDSEITAEQVHIKGIRWEETPTEGIMLFYATVQTRTNVVSHTGVWEGVIDETEVSISKEEYEKIREEMEICPKTSL
ncbi:MAG: hypothetical protein KAS32_13860 [Candidatus Peribacteraceae bacterium]|nr:hypothetical protein [Candidatus Peribacteraceae bacterium]